MKRDITKIKEEQGSLLALTYLKVMLGGYFSPWSQERGLLRPLNIILDTFSSLHMDSGYEQANILPVSPGKNFFKSQINIG